MRHLCCQDIVIIGVGGSFLSRDQGGQMVTGWCNDFLLLSASNCRLSMSTDPKLLSDKSAWSHYSAFKQFLPVDREMGHTGLCLSHCIYDRAVFASMRRKHKQLHAARKAYEEGFMHEGQARMSWLLSWDTAVPCANHDAHNALKWRALVFYPNKNTVRNMFKAI